MLDESHNTYIQTANTANCTSIKKMFGVFSNFFEDKHRLLDRQSFLAKQINLLFAFLNGKNLFKMK